MEVDGCVGWWELLAEGGFVVTLRVFDLVLAAN